MILVVGSYGAGLVMRVPRFPGPGETVGDSSMVIGHGGKSSNQAVASARQGADVALISLVGDDSFADNAFSMWSDEGVNHDGVERIPGAATMAGMILVEPDGENRIAIAPGALDEMTPEFVDGHRELFEKADVVVVCLEVPVAAAERAVVLAKEAGAVVVLNPAPAARMSHSVIAMADFFVPNQTEWEFYAADGYVPPAEQTVIRTLSSDGVLLERAGQSRTFPPLAQERVVDTTGAGDTFVGTFATGIDAGQSVDAAVERAIVSSSLSVTIAEVIPSIPSRETVDSALAAYRDTLK